MSTSQFILPSLSILKDGNLPSTLFSRHVPAIRDNVVSLLNGEISAKAWYVYSDPLSSALVSASILSLITFVAAEYNRNFSQVDRLWSLLPTIYVLHFTAWGTMHGLAPTRVYMAAAVSIVWSARLTFNYWRKGGYIKGSEDYRWEIVQKYVPPILFTLFDAFFIAMYQNLLLLSIVTPVYALLLVDFTYHMKPIGWTEIAICALQLITVATEFKADQQQWSKLLRNRKLT